MLGKTLILYAGLLGLAVASPKHRRQNASTTTSPGTTRTTTTTTTTTTSSPPVASTTTSPRPASSSTSTTSSSSRLATTSSSTTSSRIIVTSSTTSTTSTTRATSSSTSRSTTPSTTSTSTTTTTTTTPRASTTTAAPTSSTTTTTTRSSTTTTTTTTTRSSTTTTSTTSTPIQTNNAVVTGAAAVNTVNDNDGTATPSNVRRAYSGDGTPAQGWPDRSQWPSFNSLFSANTPNMRISCSQYSVPNNSEDEIANIRTAIQNVAAVSKVDHRLILAVIMQESAGCVRVPTTKAVNYNIYNPGLMQDFNGTYTCNCQQNDRLNLNCGVVNPCPAGTIQGMIREGAIGTNDGEGLASLLNIAQDQGSVGVQTFYVAANWYNQGRYGVGVGGNLSSYGVDIANRLTGWLGN